MSIKHTNGFVRYELTDQDLAVLAKTQLEHGEANIDDVLNHRMCVMQAISMLTTEQDRDLDRQAVLRSRYNELNRRYFDFDDAERDEYDQLDDELAESGSTIGDHPICVSEQITEHAIALNDSSTYEQRQQLKDLIPLLIGTCPIARVLDEETGVYYERRAYDDDEYIALEARRSAILAEAFGHPAKFEEELAALREAATLTL